MSRQMAYCFVMGLDMHADSRHIDTLIITIDTLSCREEKTSEEISTFEEWKSKIVVK